MPIFKVLQGQHAQREVTGKDEDGKPTYANRTYNAGQLVENAKDLCVFNCPGFEPKFEKVGESAPGGNPILTAPTVPVVPSGGPPAGILETLGTMTVVELTEYAGEEEIDLEGATSRDDVMAKVRAFHGRAADVTPKVAQTKPTGKR